MVPAAYYTLLHTVAHCRILPVLQVLRAYYCILHTACLLVRPVGAPLAQEGRHALLLVVQRKHAVENAPLEAQALGGEGYVDYVDYATWIMGYRTRINEMR
jgi:hypothetical protein